MSKLFADMKYLGRDPKKEFLFFGLSVLAFLGIGAAMYWYMGLNFLLLFPALGFVVYAFVFLTRYDALKRKKLEALGDEFITLFTFFGIYITDGFTVYNALEKLLDFAGEELNGLLKKLLHDIDEDKSVAPFVAFASIFEQISIREVMVAVYQMIDEGEGGLYLAQFKRLFARLADTKRSISKSTRLERLDTLSFLPLCGSGLTMLTLTLSILSIMEEMLDVL